MCLFSMAAGNREKANLYIKQLIIYLCLQNKKISISDEKDNRMCA